MKFWVAKHWKNAIPLMAVIAMYALTSTIGWVGMTLLLYTAYAAYTAGQKGVIKDKLARLKKAVKAYNGE